MKLRQQKPEISVITNLERRQKYARERESTHPGISSTRTALAGPCAKTKAPLIEEREAGSRVLEYIQLGHLGTNEHRAQIRRMRRPS